MPMPPYPVLCYRPGCGKPAVYKIAARWSDGVTEELTTLLARVTGLSRAEAGRGNRALVAQGIATTPATGEYWLVDRDQQSLIADP